VLCMISIVPLAKLLGTATEELAIRTNQTLGGLLNATFGNAVEMIIAVICLVNSSPDNDLLRVLQASLLGSILSNMLLVLGMSFFFGGLKYKRQEFNAQASSTTSSMLLLSVASIILPASYFLQTEGTPTGTDTVVNDTLLKISRGTSIVTLIIYASYLLFQLKTHKHLYEDDEGDEKATLPAWGAVVLLMAVTVLVSILSDYLVDSINQVTVSLNITPTFVGIILLPIVGNAAEHVTSVSVAMKDKMDLSIGVAVGSSVQIALLVIPFMVELGWILDKGLTLYFFPFETVALFISVLLVNSVVFDGESNWLEGALLMAIYVIIGIGFYFQE